MIGRTAALVSLLCAAPAAAEPGDTPGGSGRVRAPVLDGPPMAYIGVAQQPCATFVAVAEAERRARAANGGPVGPDEVRTTDYGAFLSWADGYLTARNETALGSREAGRNTTHEQRGRWMELFCRANRDAPFVAAVFRLRDYLVERVDAKE